MKSDTDYFHLRLKPNRDGFATKISSQRENYKKNKKTYGASLKQNLRWTYPSQFVIGLRQTLKW